MHVFIGFQAQVGDEYTDHKNICHAPFADESDKFMHAVGCVAGRRKCDESHDQGFCKGYQYAEKKYEEGYKTVSVFIKASDGAQNTAGFVQNGLLSKQRYRKGGFKRQKIIHQPGNKQAN